MGLEKTKECLTLSDTYARIADMHMHACSCEIAETPKKAKKLIEEGFEFVGEIHGEPMFRTRE